MAYNEKLADRIRQAIMNVPNVEEKLMFGGVCFMVDHKMCIGVMKEDMMCRINPDHEEEALNKTGCRPMDFTSRKMKGYVYVNDEGMRTKKQFEYWIGLCLDFNILAKASKKSKKK